MNFNELHEKIKTSEIAFSAKFKDGGEVWSFRIKKGGQVFAILQNETEYYIADIDIFTGDIQPYGNSSYINILSTLFFFIHLKIERPEWILQKYIS